METIESLQRKINAAKSRLHGLINLPIKSEIDRQLILDLREYVQALYEQRGELVRERHGYELSQGSIKS